MTDERRENPKANSRALAHHVLMRVLADNAFADRALEAALGRTSLDARDIGLVTELVYGTLRQQIYLDFLLQSLASQPLRKLPQDALVALRMGAYQIVHTRIPAHSAVNESLKLIRQKHVRGFANAVLRKLSGLTESGTLPEPSGDKRARIATLHSVPRWLLDDVARSLPEQDLEAFAASHNLPAALSFRVNTTQTSRAELQQRWTDASIAFHAHPQVPTALIGDAGGTPTSYPGFNEGDCTVQDVAAQLVGEVAAPKRGDLVLDLCAAPGGKTTHLAEQLGGEGKVLAVELHPGKTRLIRQNAERLKLANIIAHAADATDVQALSALVAQTFGTAQVDLVVLDAPCSGFGTLRKHPELKQRTASDLESLTALQDQLLDSAASCVKPGGVLVYAVCTVTHAEGPERVWAFLQRHSDFTLVSPQISSELLEPLGAAQVLRTWTHKHGMDGFFAARFVRKNHSV